MSDIVALVEANAFAQRNIRGRSSTRTQLGVFAAIAATATSALCSQAIRALKLTAYIL
jgi:hypothetical protein